MENNTPTTEQLTALVDFASCNGRTWKSALRHCWETGRYSDYKGTEKTSHLLQQVRNSFGPSWLVAFSLKQADAQIQADRQRQQLLDESEEFAGMRRNGEV